MNVYVAMNWGAWALSAILFAWLIMDFIKTEKTFSADALVGKVDPDELEGQKG